LDAKTKNRIYKRYGEDRRCVLYPGDCLELLSQIPDGVVDLTVTSPPYCIGKEYESSRSVEDFVETHKAVLPAVARVTKAGGSICWQVGTHVTSGSIVPLDYLVYGLMLAYPEFKLRNRIVWTFGHGLHATERFTGRHETILWFTKGEDYTFNLDAVRVPQKYPGKKSYKGPSKGEFSGNPLGKNPSDVWEIPNVKANHLEKTGHPCQFPLAIPSRLISALTCEGALILDPFAGSATTAAAAIQLNRRFIGAEVDLGYLKIARDRIEAAMSGALPAREDKPILDPKGTGGVSKKPEHFTWTNYQEKDGVNGDLEMAQV